MSTSDPDLPRPELSPACMQEAWRRAREDYERGVSAPVCAERHGLNQRTVRRRAASEGWRKPPRPGPVSPTRLFGAAPFMAGEPLTAEELMEREPDLEPFVEAHNYEIGELLLKPEPGRMQRFAFRRAAEAAARGAVTEAGAWMRLVGQVVRARDRLERDAWPLSGADRLRAVYARQLRQAFEDPEDEEAQAYADGEG